MTKTREVRRICPECKGHWSSIYCPACDRRHACETCGGRGEIHPKESEK